MLHDFFISTFHGEKIELQSNISINIVDFINIQQLFLMKYIQLRNLFSTTVLKKDTNQAHDLAKYAIQFMEKGKPSAKVLERSKMFHTDSVICGLSALALKTNAPHVLRN